MNRLLSMISLTKRAGKLLLGFDRVKDAVVAGKVELVLTASDLSEKSRSAIAFVCEDEEVNCFPVPITMDEFWYELGQRTGILAITDAGLAAKVESLRKSATQNEEERIL